MFALLSIPKIDPWLVAFLAVGCNSIRAADGRLTSVQMTLRFSELGS